MNKKFLVIVLVALLAALISVPLVANLTLAQDDEECVPCPCDPDEDVNDCLTRLYQEYVRAYNVLTDLMAEGKGDSPEAQEAYADYKLKERRYQALGRYEGTEGPVMCPGPCGKSNRDPTASFDILPQNPTLDDFIVCVSTSTDPDGDPITCHWGLDDEYKGEGSRCELGNLEAGEHVITLWIEDSRGYEDECSLVFTVSTHASNNGMSDGDNGGQYGLGAPVSKVKVNYLNDDGNQVSEEGSLADPCTPASISLAKRDSHGNVTRTITIPTGNLIRYDVISEITDGQLYPGQFYIPFKPISVITPNVDFTIQFIRNTPRPENIMFVGGTQVTANPDGMSNDGWYHYFVSGSNGTVGELSIIFIPGGGGGGGNGMSCQGAGYGQARQSFDISPILLGIVFISLVINVCWRRIRK